MKGLKLGLMVLAAGGTLSTGCSKTDNFANAPQHRLNEAKEMARYSSSRDIYSQKNVPIIQLDSDGRIVTNYNNLVTAGFEIPSGYKIESVEVPTEGKVEIIANSRDSKRRTLENGNMVVSGELRYQISPSVLKSKYSHEDFSSACRDTRRIKVNLVPSD